MAVQIQYVNGVVMLREDTLRQLFHLFNIVSFSDGAKMIFALFECRFAL